MSKLRFHETLVGDFELYVGDKRLGTCVGSASQALDAFAANWPGHALALDRLRDTLGVPRDAPRRVVGMQKTGFGQRKQGSGARFRELIAGGASNHEALAQVREEFPNSKATLSDAAWNRARLQKETGRVVRPVVAEGGVEGLL